MDLRESFRAMQSATGQTDKTVAKAIGISQSRLSQWLKGSYPGDNDKITKAIADYCERQKEKAELSKVSQTFVSTKNATMVDALCRIALYDHKLVVLSGDSGCGKSIALQDFASRVAGTVYEEVDPTYNPKRLFSKLRIALGRPAGGLLEDIYDDCISSLKGVERLIIIDQAELLNNKALELLRCLHDKTGVGMVLSGMPRLLENIRGMRNEYAQIYTRIGSSMRLDSINLKDAAEIVTSYLPDATNLAETFYTLSRKNARTLAILLYNVIRVTKSQNKPISAELVKYCTQALEV